MSTGPRLPFNDALQLAQRVFHEIKPLVAQAKCVGSLRRRRDTVGDLEFVVEPWMIEVDLFGTLGPDVLTLKAAVLNWSTWVKGGDRMWQVTDVFGREGVKLDIYLAYRPAEWGSLVAIRTGPWELGRIAVTRLRERGTPHRDGHVPGHPTPTEEAFFELAGLECRPPHERDAYAEQLARELAGRRH